VTPSQASSTDIAKCVVAIHICSGSASVKLEPGLRSVAIAIATPAARSAAIGGTGRRSCTHAPGSMTATVPAAAAAAMPAALICST
jgi:hypothetical protein